MAFNPKEFLELEKNLIVQQFLTLKKDDLIGLGQELGVEVQAKMRKSELRDLVLSGLIQEELIDEGSVEIPKPATSLSALEIRKMELQHAFEMKKLEFDREEREKARQEKLAVEDKKLAAEQRARELEFEKEKFAADQKKRYQNQPPPHDRCRRSGCCWPSGRDESPGWHAHS